VFFAGAIPSVNEDCHVVRGGVKRHFTTLAMTFKLHHHPTLLFFSFLSYL
jgi:hypothetical protein